MKYEVHAKLGSFYAIALALFQEIIEGGPNYGTGEGFEVPSPELLHIHETAGVLGKIALRDASIEDYESMNMALTEAAREANERSYRHDHYLVNTLFDSFYPGFEGGDMIASLEADPALFDLKPGETDATAESRMIETAFSILPGRNVDNEKQFVLGLSLLVTAAVLAIRNGRTSPDDMTYPRQKVRLQYGGPLVDADDLKGEVYGMARAIVARIPLQQ